MKYFENHEVRSTVCSLLSIMDIMWKMFKTQTATIFHFVVALCLSPCSNERRKRHKMYDVRTEERKKLKGSVICYKLTADNHLNIANKILFNNIKTEWAPLTVDVAGISDKILCVCALGTGQGEQNSIKTSETIKYITFLVFNLFLLFSRFFTHCAHMHTGKM